MTNERTVVFTVNGVRLHSAYNPQAEAERFVSSLEAPFLPKAVIVTEPALSYIAEPLKKRFPGIPVCAIRYSESFKDVDSYFTQVFYGKEKSLAEELFSYFGEETLSASLFVSWQPSAKAFPKEDENVWEEIKKAVLKSRDVLATRTYFSKRWAKNAVRFCALIKTQAFPQKTDSPVIICASGPSLTPSLPLIKKNRNRAIVLALSSAVSPLKKEGIVPDMILSTDGGYWAKAHLRECHFAFREVPLALSAESACPSKLLLEHAVVPLSYGDGISESLIKESGIKALQAERNGTVSGTAACLALKLSTGPIFFCGLDLSPSSGKVHAEPNQNENRDSLRDMKLCTKETRLTPSHFASPSLDLYASWFRSRNFNGRIFRLSLGSKYKNSFPNIPDVDWNFFEKTCTAPVKPLAFSFTGSEKENTNRIKDLEQILDDHRADPVWQKDAFPALCILRERSISGEQKAQYESQINKESEKLNGELKALLAGGHP